MFIINIITIFIIYTTIRIQTYKKKKLITYFIVKIDYFSTYRLKHLFCFYYMNQYLRLRFL